MASHPLSVDYPREDELLPRLVAHLRARNGDELAVLVWSGYIWALGEKAFRAVVPHDETALEL